MTECPCKLMLEKLFSSYEKTQAVLFALLSGAVNQAHMLDFNVCCCT